MNNSQYRIDYTGFILLILLIPEKNIFLLFGLTSLFIIIFRFNNESIRTKDSDKMLFLFCFLLVASTARFIITFEPNLRDYFEAFRWLPLFLLFLHKQKFKYIKIENIVDALLIYLILDGLISYFQYINNNTLGLLNLVHIIYNSDTHFYLSLGLSDRILGLSMGPGQHGSLIFSVFVVLFINIFNIKGFRKILCIFGSILSFIIIVSTQSRTAFLSAILIVTIIVLIFFIRGRLKTRIAIIISLVIAFLFLNNLWGFLGNFHYLYQVFSSDTSITNVSSYQSREMKWTTFFDLMLENPSWFPIGWGKDYFGAGSSSMDSDYLYIFSVYGLVILVIFIVSILKFLVKIFIIRKWSYSSTFIKIFSFLILGGLIIAWPSSFFIQLKICLILSLLKIGDYWDTTSYPSKS